MIDEDLIIKDEEGNPLELELDPLCALCLAVEDIAKIIGSLFYDIFNSQDYK